MADQDVKQRPWMAPIAAGFVGMIVVGAVVTVWEFTGLYSHGFVRFALSSALVGLLAYVLQSKPAVTK